jgi:predicted nucleotidyltransferase
MATTDMMYGLKPETIKAILAVFEKYVAVEKAIPYGSRAKGTYLPGSDIDLTLEGEGLDLYILHKIETDLDDLLLPYKIDLSLLKHIRNPELVQHIKRIGIDFYVVKK